MFIGILCVLLLLLPFVLGANLVGATTLPIRTIQRNPRVAPYKFLRIQMRGRSKDGGPGAGVSINGLTVYRDLYLTFDYGPGPSNACNPVQNQETQKISLVQGQLALGTAAVVTSPANITIAGGIITAIVTSAAGVGYNQLAPPLVMIFDTGGGSGAYATATVGPTGTITAINVLFGGSGYTAATTVTIVAPGQQGFQGTVAGPLIASVFARDWINNGIFARWIDTISDKELMVGSATLVGPAPLGGGAAAAPGSGGVVPAGGAGGYITPTGDGGIGALGSRLPLDNNVTVQKYTGQRDRSWSGRPWHPCCVPTTFFVNDDMSVGGKAAWSAIKAAFMQPITDGQSVLYPISISQVNSRTQQNPTEIAWTPIIHPGWDPVRNVYDPIVNNTLGESRRRKEKHGLTF